MRIDATAESLSAVASISAEISRRNPGQPEQPSRSEAPGPSTPAGWRDHGGGARDTALEELFDRLAAAVLQLKEANPMATTFPTASTRP